MYTHPFPLFFTILVSLCVCSNTHQLAESEPQFNLYKGQACEQYSNKSVQRFSSDIWLFQNYSSCVYASTDIQAMVLKFSVESLNATDDRESLGSVIFAAKSNGLMQSWQLPFKPDYDEKSSVMYQYSKRTICQLPSSRHDNELVLDVFTGSKEDIQYSIELEPAESFELNLTTTATLNASFTELQLHYFQFPDDIDAVIVEANSKTKNKCAIVSIQNASCPVNDQLDNGRSKGMYQTMTSSASIVVRADDMDGNRDFFIVVIAASQDICQKGNHRKDKTSETPDDDNGPHQITLTVKELKPLRRYTTAIVIPLIVFVVIGVLCFLLFVLPCFDRCLGWTLCGCCKCSRRRSTYYGGEDKTLDDESEPLITEKREVNNYSSPTNKQPEINNDSLERNKLVLADRLNEVNHDELDKKYCDYGWITIIVGIYYALPAFQLVYSQGMILNSSNGGNQDLCYYNFKCAHPAFAIGINSFNNVWSNIGYLVMGVSFIAIVAARHYKASKEKRQKKGVPQFFGIYYAMGFALIMEGIMSSFYHICPSNSNFQFDTAFMFIISGLPLVKMLQARHPDIQANAFVAFLCLAVVTFLTLVGIWQWSKPYWEARLTLIIIGLMGIIVFLISFYSFHDWRIKEIKNNCSALTNWFKRFCDIKRNVKKILPKHKFRFCKIVFLVLVNIAVAIALRQEIIATIVLALLIANFMVLMIFYLSCKLWYSEPITVLPAVLSILVIVSWIAALIFFNIDVTDREKSPAFSRDDNKDCYAMGFYDQHDVWHFLSIVALFCSFLFVLTLDDGTKNMEWKDLHVF